MEQQIQKKSTFHFLFSRDAQSTLEVIIALTILTTALTSAALVVMSSQSLSVDSQESSVALRLAQQNLESVTASSKDNFATLSTSSSTQGEFTKTITVATTSDVNTKLVTSQVTWRTDPFRTQKVELTTLVTNWYAYQARGGNLGGSGPTGNWKNPKNDGNADIEDGGYTTGIDAVSSTVYITENHAGAANFFIFSATDPLNISLLSAIDTGAGLNSIYYAPLSNLAYVAANSTSSQLKIINVSNPSSPTVKKSFQLSGVSGSGAIGKSIFYNNSKVFVGTKTATGPEFHVVDVTSSTNPVDLGSYKVGADINSIFVSGNTAYLATSDSSAELRILDVSNPASITSLATYNATGTEAGLSIYGVGTTIYLGRASAGDNEFLIFDVSTPSSPQLLGSASIGGKVNGITARNGLAFLGTENSSKKIQIWDVSSPASSSLWSYLNPSQTPSAVHYENNYVYVVAKNGDALTIVTSQ